MKAHGGKVVGLAPRSGRACRLGCFGGGSTSPFDLGYGCVFSVGRSQRKHVLVNALNKKVGCVRGSRLNGRRFVRLNGELSSCPLHFSGVGGVYISRRGGV